MNLIKVIQEAATWIEKVNKDYESNLYRSQGFLPQTHFVNIPEDKQAQVIDAVVTKRSFSIKDRGVSLIPVEELVSYGRIMFFDVNSTLWEGVSQAESMYYVDIYDTPPVDTWIAYGSQLVDLKMFKEYDPYLKQSIVAWVPKAQYFYAHQAMLVSSTDVFAWPNPDHLTDTYTSLKPIFRAPDRYQESTDKINLTRRKVLMDAFENELDKNSYKY